MSLLAWRCPNGHLLSPHHPRCRHCGEAPTESIDLSDRVGEVVTWTRSTATPPGVRRPNPLAIVEFPIGDDGVRVIGGLASDEVATGDRVEPVYVDELRDPEAGIRLPETQTWDGYRFRLVEGD